MLGLQSAAAKATPEQKEKMSALQIWPRTEAHLRWYWAKWARWLSDYLKSSLDQSLAVCWAYFLGLTHLKYFLYKAKQCCLNFTDEQNLMEYIAIKSIGQTSQKLWTYDASQTSQRNVLNMWSKGTTADSFSLKLQIHLKHLNHLQSTMKMTFSARLQ